VALKPGLSCSQRRDSGPSPPAQQSTAARHGQPSSWRLPHPLPPGCSGDAPLSNPAQNYDQDMPLGDARMPCQGTGPPPFRRRAVSA